MTAFALGCGATQSRVATEQLLTSDAVDRAVARIDFRPLAGQKVWLDAEYIRPVKGVGSVNAEYVISSLRQQILAAGCQLQDGKSQADYVIEPRVGALGLDGSEVIYGIPASNALGIATAVVPTAPPVPTIPEIAFAKKHNQMGAAKIAVFAYDRVSRDVVWQSGLLQSLSNAKDSWMLGVGPFQSGTIHDGTRFAGTEIGRHQGEPADGPAVQRYEEARVFRRPVAAQAAAATSPAPGVAATAVPSAIVPAGASVVVPATTEGTPRPVPESFPWAVEPPAEAEVPAEFLPTAIPLRTSPGPFPDGPARPMPGR